MDEGEPIYLAREVIRTRLEKRLANRAVDEAGARLGRLGREAYDAHPLPRRMVAAQEAYNIAEEALIEAMMEEERVYLVVDGHLIVHVHDRHLHDDPSADGLGDGLIITSWLDD